MMFLENRTPDGNFMLMIGSVFEDEGEKVPDASLLQLVQLTEQTARTLRLAIDPNLHRIARFWRMRSFSASHVRVFRTAARAESRREVRMP
jgi:hypothetical protein